MFSLEGRCRCSSVYILCVERHVDQRIVVTLYVQINTVILSKHFLVFRGG